MSRTRVSRCYVRVILAIVCALFLALVGAAGAQAETRYVQSGQFPSSFGFPLGGLAVEQSTGDVYVADSAGNEVQKFDAAGVFILSFGGGVDQTSGANVCTAASGDTCQPGTAGAGNGQFGGGPFTGASSVAVDQASGDVYVTDGVNNRVEKFASSGSYLSQFNGSATPAAGFSFPNSIAVDPTSAAVYVLDAGNGVVDRFSSAGAYLCQVTGRATPSASECNVAGSATPAGSFSVPSDGVSAPGGLAVDSTGRLYVGDVGNSVVDEFDSSGAFLGQLGSGTLVSPSELAVDSSNDVFVVDRSGPSIVEFDAGGNQLTSSPASSPLVRGIAVNDASRTVYMSNASFFGGSVLIFVPITVPGVTTGAVSSLQQTTATLNGVVNPDGVQLTDCHFVYTDDADFKANGYSGPHAQSAPCVPGASSIAADHGDHNVTASITGLSPTTTYHFRLLAADVNGVSQGQDSTFATPGPPTIDSTSVANVTATSADLRAQINPNLFDTHYHFEYVDDATFQVSGFAGATKAPQPDADLGSAATDQAAGVHVQGLAPGAIYHYRVVADNGNGGPQNGPAHTFITEPTGNSFVLPDGRAYELVTPPNKGDGDLDITGNGFFYAQDFGVQASASGDKIAFGAFTPFPGSQAGPINNSYLASRGASGWATQPGLIPPQASTTGLGQKASIVWYSADLSKAALQDGGAVASTGAGQDSPALVPGEPANNQNLFIGDNSTGSYQLADVTPAGATPSMAAFAGASADLSHVVFYSSAQLTSNAPAGENLYEWAAGTVRLVSILPDNTQVSGAQLGDAPNHLLHAVSDDGSRIFFKANGNLYVRENGASTVQVDASQGGPQNGGGQFMTATPDGSKVFFIAGQLTSNAASEDLYEYDVTTGHLTDLTVDNADAKGAQVQGVVGASNDGSYVYFVALGNLASGATSGPASQANLYVEHNATTTFIATLQGSGPLRDDSFDWSSDGLSTARVSADGTHVAFDSVKSLTGYDNTIVSGNDCFGGHNIRGTVPRCDEVFVYDARSNQLACASCNPSGARPLGSSSIAEPTNGVVNSIGLGDADPSPLPRALSDDGSRVFFESQDALVPHDTNGKLDVYEYEAEGDGPQAAPCGLAAASGSEVFKPAHGEEPAGCVALISSGTSREDSLFADASASGNDVFFVTGSQLVGQDTDDKLDIYDAHVCSAAVPCFATPPVAPPACTTGDSCRAAPASQPAIFGPPPSATFSGAGNLVPLPSKPVVKPKGLTRAQKLSKALRACKKRPKRERASCVAQAHRRYGTKASARKTAKRSTTRAKRGGSR